VGKNPGIWQIPGFYDSGSVDSFCRRREEWTKFNPFIVRPGKYLYNHIVFCAPANRTFSHNLWGFSEWTTPYLVFSAKMPLYFGETVCQREFGRKKPPGRAGSTQHVVKQQLITRKKYVCFVKRAPTAATSRPCLSDPGGCTTHFENPVGSRLRLTSRDREGAGERIDSHPPCPLPDGRGSFPLR